VLTKEDFAAHPFFSSFAPDVLAALAHGSADIHLNAGEFVVHEGESPALFAVLAGSIEVVKLVDGVERRIGMRAPGQIFGEIPIVYGTQFQGSYRALEPSRVARVDGRQYYEVAGTSQELARAIGDLARDRIGGLPGIAAEKRTARVLLVGSRWDTATHDLRRFLVRSRSWG
jgi:thioredoxin reductase (NADPH)